MAANKRSNNFSRAEERTLLDLVFKYKHIIECKKTDTIMNRKKIEIWVEIMKEFNAMSAEVFRDAKTLKNKYENLKKRTKHKVAEERQALLRTGGGPYTESRIDSMDQRIIDMLGVRAEGMSSEFGDDVVLQTTSMAEPQSVQCTTGSQIVQEIDLGNIEVLIHDPSTSDNVFQDNADSNTNANNLGKNQNWATYTPDMLRQPKSKALQGSGTPTQKKGNIEVLINNSSASDNVSQDNADSNSNPNNLETNENWATYIPDMLRQQKSKALQGSGTSKQKKGNIEVLVNNPSTSDNVFQDNADSNINPNNLETNQNWATYTPDMLRQPKSKALQGSGTPKQKKGLGDKIEKWAASKTDFESLKKRLFQEEHDIKIKHLQNLHAKQMEILIEESQQRMNREKEKHQVEMRILKNKLMGN